MRQAAGEEAVTTTLGEGGRFWPSPQAVLAMSGLGAVAVGVDTYFNARAGYVARPPEYDGIGYMLWARELYLLMHGLHLHQALIHINPFAPLWVIVMSLNYLVLGDGTWQAFTSRIWCVAPLLLLVYWVVRRRSNRWLGIAAALITGLLPIVSPGVHAAAWDFLTQQEAYGQDWYWGDLRPDFFAGVLLLWAIAILAEDEDGGRRSVYLVSATFTVAAVLAKPTTSPATVAVWAAAIGMHWLRHRRKPVALRLSLLAIGWLLVILFPWAVTGSVSNIVAYLGALGSFGTTYALASSFPDNFTYFLTQLPDQLGRIEIWPVVAGTGFVAAALARRQLKVSDVMYGVNAFLLYLIFSIPATKNPHLMEWITLSFWLFLLAGASRLASKLSAPHVKVAGRSALVVAAAYVGVVYAVGFTGLAQWPALELKSHAELVSLNSDIARVMSRYVHPFQCFAYTPGPGWPADLQYLMMDDLGNPPVSTAIDVDPSSISISDYIAADAKCNGILAYREDISDVGQFFYVPPARAPYLRAVAQWVRSPDSGYSVVGSWTMSNLVSDGPHPMGHGQVVSLTVDLYVHHLGT